MATKRLFICSACGDSEGAGNLLEALLRVVDRHPPNCQVCGEPKKLHLKFPFAFGASGGGGVVLGCYLPKTPPEWEDHRSDVTVTFSTLRDRIKEVGAILRFLKPEFLEELSEECVLEEA